MTLTLDFQGQILKMLYLGNGRADWHGTKGMWVDRMLDSLCDFELWPHAWPWIFKVNFLNSCISGMGGPINMEWKGYESIGCYSYYVTLSYDFDLGFWRSNFEKALIIGIRGWIDIKGYESIGCSVGNSVKKWLESQIINIRLKENQQTVPNPPPKLSTSDWRTCGNFLHYLIGYWTQVMT